jgi:nicotinamide-nucleotide amidase
MGIVYIMQTISEEQLYRCTELLAATLKQFDLTLASAESCTGGWLAKCCTDLAGSSAWFDGGIVSYSNQFKHDFLGVKQQTLDQFGAVSEQAAIEMAQGVLTNTSADISVAITGIAGPAGGSEAKPVGTIWLAWQTKQGIIITALHHFDGDRDSIRSQAVMAALQGIIKNARD